MDTNPIAFQFVVRLSDDRVIAPDAARRRTLARCVLDAGEPLGLLAFGAADTHLHVLATCSREQATRLGRALVFGLRPALGHPVGFDPPAITPVRDQHHLAAAFGYVQRNARRHGVLDASAVEASSLPDLLWLRSGARWLGDRVKRALPRVSRRDLVALLALPDLPLCGPVAPDLPDACAAAFGLADLRGKAPMAVRARATGLSMVDGQWTTRTIAEAFGVSERAIQRLRAHAVSPSDAEALRRQLGWRAAVRAAAPAGY